MAFVSPRRDKRTMISPGAKSRACKQPSVIADGLKLPEALAGWRLFGFHHFDERIKQVSGIVGAGRGLRVILDGKDWQALVAKALDGAVVQVDVSYDSALGLQRLLIDREPVILAGDLDPPGIQILDWLISATVAELELVSRCPDRAAKELVAEADPEDRYFPDRAEQRPDCIVERGGVAGT